MKLHCFGSLCTTTATIAFLGSAAIVRAQEPAGQQEPTLTPEVFVDRGPTAEPFVLATQGLEGPAIVVEYPAEERPDVFPRFDKDPATLDTVPRQFLGNPYFLGFGNNLYRPPAGERVDPLLVQRMVTANEFDGDLGRTWAFVMIEGRNTAEKRDRITSLGVRLLRYHPNNCYSASIPLDRILALSELPEVHWVGYPRPSQKIHFNLRAGVDNGSLWGRIPVWINLYESDLGPTSVKVVDAMPVETEPGGILRLGNPAHASMTWQTNSALLETLQRLGFENLRYHENIDAYEGTLNVEAIGAIAALEKVQHVEWAPAPAAGHDRHIPQTGQDYERETVRVLTNTIGIADSGFNVNHWDLNIWGVGWSYWGAGGCGGVFCDEAGEGYHGSHTLGSIRGTGSANNIYRGNSPYNGSQSGAQRIFCVKGYTYSAFQHYRNAYTDGANVTSPRPFLSSHSWRSGGCVGNPGVAANWIGSESGARTVDDEVFNYNQLYVFCGGNEGDCGGNCGLAGTEGIPSVAKNALTVGAVWDDVTGEGEAGIATCFSSNGPCGDGRWKPNVVAPGCNTMSVDGGTSGASSNYSNKCGCSMATPTTAGVLSGAAEKYAWDWSSLARAWAMGCAVSWQDTVGSSGSVQINRYGLGRISAVKTQEGGGSYPWFRNWAGSTITSEIDTFDITVYANCTRLIVVETWDDPQCSAGASSAHVNDIDLWLQNGTLTTTASGQWSSRTVAQTVEYIVVSSPAEGIYRVKVDPYSNSTTNLRWGVFVIQLFGDTTPSGSLSAAVSDSFIQPGQNVTVDVTAETNSYIATNVYLDKGTHTGLTQTAAETTLKDGQLINTNFTDTLLGDIVAIGNNSRTATYTFNASSTTDAVRSLNWEARSDNWGTRNVSANVTVDGTPPPAPGNIASSSHPANGWSNNPNITFSWSQGLDNLSGIQGWGEFISTGTGAPSNTLDFTTPSPRVVTAPSDGQWYYNLKTVDRSDNWSATHTSSAAWYGVDTVLPTLPANLASTSHTPGVWRNDATVDFVWPAGTDDRSGLDGYGESWGSAPGVVVANSKDFEENVTSITKTFASGTWYYALKCVDNAGNWTAGTREAGPYLVDVVNPAGPTGLSSPTHTPGVWSSVALNTVTWTAATDAHSGLAGYDISWDRSPVTVVNTTLDIGPAEVSRSFTLTTDRNGWWFHIAPRDNAGNWGPTQHIGPFQVDTSAPNGPSNLSSSTHTPNVWSNQSLVTMNWTAATDPESGVNGHRSLWDHTATTDPAGNPNLGSIQSSESFSPGGSASGWYYHLKARNNSGIWGPLLHFGPILIDLGQPSGSVVIDSGNATVNGLAVSLAITATDTVSGVDAIRIRNNGGAFSAWMPFAANVAWNLSNNGGSTGTGTRTVTVEIRDRALNVRSVSDTIYYFTPVTYFGSSCAGSLGQPTFLVSGIPGLGQSISFVPGNTAAPVGALYLGVSNTLWNGINLPLDLGFLNSNSTGCFLNVSLDLTVYSGAPVALPINIPLDGTIVGIPLFYQWHFYGDPSGKLVVTTRGARVVASDV